jgi:hypothetical protein
MQGLDNNFSYRGLQEWNIALMRAIGEDTVGRRTDVKWGVHERLGRCTDYIQHDHLGETSTLRWRLPHCRQPRPRRQTTGPT